MKHDNRNAAQKQEQKQKQKKRTRKSQAEQESGSECVQLNGGLNLFLIAKPDNKVGKKRSALIAQMQRLAKQ
jgi:hypothetical protein